MSVTVDEILEALPDGDLLVSIRNASGVRTATNIPIERPDAMDPEDDLPRIRIVYSDEDMGMGWPVQEIQYYTTSDVVALIGPKGTAFIRAKDGS